eukprot:GHVU01125900.1.p2 GENE.GHVU01125900.1~~GHVU01125900.1.p2  ORF type:complete len:158 (+),score=10.80 GHVU01125900.1:305-778(+)
MCADTNTWTSEHESAMRQQHINEPAETHASSMRRNRGWPGGTPSPTAPSDEQEVCPSRPPPSLSLPLSLRAQQVPKCFGSNGGAAAIATTGGIAATCDFHRCWRPPIHTGQAGAVRRAAVNSGGELGARHNLCSTRDLRDRFNSRMRKSSVPARSPR